MNYDPKIEKDFLRHWKVLIIKEKNDKLDFIKLKNVYLKVLLKSKRAIHRVRQKICNTYYQQRTCVQSIYITI